MSEDESRENRNNPEDESSPEVKLELNLQIDEELLRTIFYFNNNGINCGEEHIARMNTQQNNSTSYSVNESVQAKDEDKKAMSITRSVKLKCWSMKKFEKCKAKLFIDSDFEDNNPLCTVKSEPEDEDFAIHLTPENKAPCAEKGKSAATTSKSQNENNAPCSEISIPKESTSKSQQGINLEINTEDSDNGNYEYSAEKSGLGDTSFGFELSPTAVSCPVQPISQNDDNLEIKTDDITENNIPGEMKCEPEEEDFVFELTAIAEYNSPCLSKSTPKETTSNSQNGVNWERKIQDFIHEINELSEIKSELRDEIIRDEIRDEDNTSSAEKSEDKIREESAENRCEEINAPCTVKSKPVESTSKPQNCVKIGNNETNSVCAEKSKPEETTFNIATKHVEELENEIIAPNDQEETTKTGAKAKHFEKRNEQEETFANLPDNTDGTGKNLENEDELRTTDTLCVKTGGKRKCREDDTFSNEKSTKRICTFWKLGSLRSTTSGEMPHNQGSTIEYEPCNKMDISMNSSKDSSEISNSPSLNKQNNEAESENGINIDVSMNSSKDKGFPESCKSPELNKHDNKDKAENSVNMDISMNSSKDTDNPLGQNKQDNQIQLENDDNMDISMNSSKDKANLEVHNSSGVNEQGNETETENFGYMDISMNSSKDQEIPDISNPSRLIERYNETISLYAAETETNAQHEEATNITNSGNDNLNQSPLDELEHENLIGFEVDHSGRSPETEVAVATSMVEPDNIPNEQEIAFHHVNVNDLSEKSSLNSGTDPLGSVNEYVRSESDISTANHPIVNENPDHISEYSNSTSDPIVSHNEFIPSGSDISAVNRENMNENPHLSENSDPIVSNNEYMPSESDISVVNHESVNEVREHLSENSNSISDSLASNSDSIHAIASETPDLLSEMTNSNSVPDSQLSDNEFAPSESDISVENYQDESSTGYEADDEARISRRRRELERRQQGRGAAPQHRNRRGTRQSNSRNLAIAERNSFEYIKQCNNEDQKNNDD